MRLLFPLLLLSSLLAAQPDYQAAVDRFAGAEIFRNAAVGVALIDPTDNRVLAAYEADRSLIPASNLKVVATATALQLLGPEHRFQTYLELDGTVDTEGTLQGNVIIRGGGDPVLGSTNMDEADDLETVLHHFENAIKAAGIRRIAGTVIADDRYFTAPPVPGSWQYNDLGNYYASGAHGLNIHENLYYLDFEKGAQRGSTTRVAGVRPNVPVQFRNEVTSAGPRSGDNAYIYGSPFTYQRTLRGTIPSGSGTFTIKGSIPDPPLFAVQLLTDRLCAAGIEVSGIPTTSRYVQLPESFGKSIYVHQSPPLWQIVERANLRSVNLYCEVLLLHIGKALGNQTDRDDASDALKNYWEDRGVPTEGWFQQDGSGLSRLNGITPRQLALVLAKVTKDERIFPYFERSIPLAGETGSLKNRMKGSITKGRVRGKTGTLNRVRAYTGYIYPNPGQPIAYSIIMNNYSGSSGDARREMETLLTDLLR